MATTSKILHLFCLFVVVNGVFSKYVKFDSTAKSEDSVNSDNVNKINLSSDLYCYEIDKVVIRDVEAGSVTSDEISYHKRIKRVVITDDKCSENHTRYRVNENLTLCLDNMYEN
ncbi:uncharacterized protein LOC111348007 [Spodoptera litura]|uniref:Uncharacterized protein LOC111348007 n=1 Tax=Spodoptera litura TaxID=69820 RepID=A0A9J7DPX5_SPOLT|nr:uncharacterized protein LOC111348007 [Spodoptera litura]